ncbi:esterase-like activity of phytase family protein [Rhizobium sp. P40RR-XXII]|uniref:esterase-like activity of phytase family protein n=1 Tax=unclassified Rhizobium TaxID=2613769 RepID=UPI0014576518|nr:MULTISPECIES: esterase-like activity of phytase family protein [unclassified Rhizobium]NLR83489.1 esterase-like activity of phytase family protein [Rhizobium sp. P28RR-XV]NLS15909.1 esterase-like activity of phytase family protein [Rhizobium sp. P40RR-XXII]
MLKSFLTTVAAALLLGFPVRAADIGTTIDVPCPFGDCNAGISLSYLGSYDIPTGFTENGVEVGGLSGIEFDPSTGRYISISDDRSEKAPARFYRLDIDVGANGLNGVAVLDHVTLKDKDGQPFAFRKVDAESIRFGRDGIYWSSEGDGKALLPPFVRIADRDGNFMREFSLPAGFAPTADKGTGIRDNLAFEGLAFLPGGDLIVGTESALYQDGPITTLTGGALARLIRYDVATGEQKAQYAYPISPIPQAPSTASGWNDFGLSEILALDDRHLLSIERGYAQGVGNSVVINMFDLDGATDVSNIPSLAKTDQRIVPVRKTQIMDLRALGLAPDNIEGITFGKAKDGTDVLILVADNNFNPTQKTQFFAFKVIRRPS